MKIRTSLKSLNKRKTPTVLLSKEKQIIAQKIAQKMKEQRKTTKRKYLKAINKK